MCGARERLLFREHAGLRQERGDRRERDRVDRDRRESSLRSRGCRRAPLYCEMHHAGVAVGAVRQRQHVTGIDEVRVLDLRIDLPDLRPEPRVLEEHRGDVPQRVAALHGVVHRRVGADELRRRLRRFGRRRFVQRGDGGFGRRQVVGRVSAVAGRDGRGRVARPAPAAAATTAQPATRTAAATKAIRAKRREVRNASTRGSLSC